MVIAAPTKVSKPVEKPARSAKKVWATIAAIVLCQVLAIAFVELFLYCAGLGEEEVFHFDREIGFVHMHNKRITWRSEGFAVSYLNDDGMREPNLTIAKPANTYRVALMGDSMVEGFQVPLDKTFGQIIQRRLSPLAGKQIQVLNFGTSGYSTVQEYLLIKRQVFKYHPDLVIDCYDSRDMFENWSPPDQVVTNVRPYALDLPGNDLVIHNLPVRRWLRSPRGQLMMSTNWLRAHSRIAGMLAALDLEQSQHNRFYRAIVDLISHPKNIVADFKEAVASLSTSGPSFSTTGFDQTKPASAVAGAGLKPSVETTFNSASGNAALEKTPLVVAARTNSAPQAGGMHAAPTGADGSEASANVHNSAAPQNSTYKMLVTRTLGALFVKMREDSRAAGSDFAVMTLPVRSQLCPAPGMETQFFGIDYAGELEIVRSVCAQAGIPVCDSEHSAESTSMPKRESFFYAAHLTPEGQQFVADDLQPFVRRLLLNPNMIPGRRTASPLQRSERSSGITVLDHAG